MRTSRWGTSLRDDRVISVTKRDVGDILACFQPAQRARVCLREDLTAHRDVIEGDAIDGAPIIGIEVVGAVIWAYPLSQ